MFLNIFIFKRKFKRLNTLGASVVTQDKTQFVVGVALSKRHLFIPAGMITEGRLAYPTSAQNLSSVGGFRNYIKECYCCFIQPTDKDYRDVKGQRSLTATVRHRENSKDLPGLEPMSSANRALLRSRSSKQFYKIAMTHERTKFSNLTTGACVQHTDHV